MDANQVYYFIGVGLLVYILVATGCAIWMSKKGRHPYDDWF